MKASPRPEAEDLVPTLARPILAKHLRKLAAKVKAINTRYGRSAEKTILEKDEVAADLDRLAAMLENAS